VRILFPACSLLAALRLAASAVAFAQDPKLDSGTPIPPEQACYDVLSYDLALKVDPEQKTIGGTLGLRARVVTASASILLDLDDRLTVASITRDQQKIDYAREPGRIRVRGLEEFAVPGAIFEFTVAYSGVPREAVRPPWDGGFTWAETKSGAPWIATSCQGEGADLWWPSKDQPSDEPEAMDIRITVPEPLVCASNGRLMKTEAAGRGWRTFHWHVSTPINNYSVALNIAPYKTIEGEMQSVAGETFPLIYYVLPENYDKGKKLFKEIELDLAFFESVFGPYPFRADKYGVAETPHLGMEHQTITAYGNNYQGNPWGADQGFDFLLHHEMAHEWWALLVTAQNWNDFWIHEGFGTYSQALYAERLKGAEAYRHVMGEQRRGIANRGAVAPREPRSSQEMYFTSKWKDSPSGDIYNKGSWVIHSLRYLLGDEDFFRVLRRFAYPDPAMEKLTDGSPCRFATTDELLDIAQKETKRDLAWFWELYLRQPALPELISEVKDGALHLRWKTPKDLPFPMPVDVEIAGKITRVEMPDGASVLPLRGRKNYVLDPHAWLLRAPDAAPQK
jgi:aminopeptidase N